MMLWLIFGGLAAATVGFLLWPLLRRRSPETRNLRWIGVAIVALLLPVATALVYAELGAPELPGQPYALRMKDDPDFAPVVRAEEEFNLGLKTAQAGNYRKAVAIWRDLQKTSAPDAPWMATVDGYIKAAAAKGGFDPAEIAPEPNTQ